jgi:SAM-dependent methyltransferase
VIDRAIIQYYDRLAPTYDAERFGHSYGQFIDAQERAILGRMLPQSATRVLDIGCGTGRLSGFATHGCDASVESLEVARRKVERAFVGADATGLPFDAGAFDAAFSFHLLMHLEPAAIAMLLREAGRVLEPGGVFIADIPSGLRRRLRPRRDAGWHGATSLTMAQFRDLATPAGLTLRKTAGIALMPVHRIPHRLRGALARIDQRLAGLAPACASYMVGCFVKERRA